MNSPMLHPAKKKVVAEKAQSLPKSELLLHFISSLRTECYLYASILRDEIRRRYFSTQELIAIRNSSFYPLLNGVLEEN